MVPDFPRRDDPLALAAATIYVPTRRAARALAGELGRLLPHPVALLPRIVPLGQMEGLENELVFGEPEAFDATAADLAPAVPELERRLTLAGLVLAWARTMRKAALARDDDEEAETHLVAASPAQAWHLSADLATLVDDLAIEGLPWSALDGLAPDDHDRYWRLTLDFLQIAAKAWPAYLDERGLVERARRQAELVARAAARLASGIDDAPVIAIGSTGTNRATAQLLAAIASAPRGAVVLPALDMDLDARSWGLVGGGRDGESEPASGHPQAALFRLMPVLGVSREDVVALGSVEPVLAARQRFLSEAFVPPDATERWTHYARAGLALALADVTLVEAADEREEALALAIRLRETLETPEATAALVTPDRELARRVRSDLARWGIDIDDSGGEPLFSMPAGILARLVLAAREGVRAPGDLLGLLAHPAARFGFPRARLEALTPALEIGVLRTVLPDDADPAAAIDAGRDAAQRTHAHPAAKRIASDDWRDCRLLLERLDAALAPFMALSKADEPQPLASWIEAHRDALTGATDGAVPDTDDARALVLLFEELVQTPSPLLAFTADDYIAFIDRVLRETTVRGPSRSHPRLRILGLLEARLLTADVVLLGGLDETIWPPQTSTDAFLNRPMRAQLGLSPPERRIGQTAHDFVQAMGARTIVISRAQKRGGAPSVPSRFLQRMQALAGDEIWGACRSRGEALLGLAREIDRPALVRSTRRPEPRPAVELRPVRLSVTRIETLRRDPYSIFAQYVLRLVPLEPLGIAIGAREAGTELHGALADFALDVKLGEWPADVRAVLFDTAEERLAALLRNAEWRAFHWPRMQHGLDAFLPFERERRAGARAILVEQSGSLKIPLGDGSIFELTGTADRIELRADGTYAILDYKSGSIPSAKQIEAGFSPQLSLEAAMLERGAFPAATGAARVSEAAHVKVLGVETIGVQTIASKNATLEGLVADHYDGLVELVEQFRNLDTPYVPRPYPQFVSQYGAYDHLARVREWSAGDEGESA